MLYPIKGKTHKKEALELFKRWEDKLGEQAKVAVIALYETMPLNYQFSLGEIWEACNHLLAVSSNEGIQTAIVALDSRLETNTLQL